MMLSYQNYKKYRSKTDTIFFVNVYSIITDTSFEPSKHSKSTNNIP